MNSSTSIASVTSYINGWASLVIVDCESDTETSSLVWLSNERRAMTAIWGNASRYRSEGGWPKTVPKQGAATDMIRPRIASSFSVDTAWDRSSPFVRTTCVWTSMSESVNPRISSSLIVTAATVTSLPAVQRVPVPVLDPFHGRSERPGGVEPVDVHRIEDQARHNRGVLALRPLLRPSPAVPA